MSVVQDLIRDMSLWKPQREGIKALDQIMTVSPVGRGIDKRQTLSPILAINEPPANYAIQHKLFDIQEEINPAIGTQFPSFCFAIATGGGKTRLMGACIAYLYLTKGFKNFFILSKGDTIYNKHRFDDFPPASPKYVFMGLSGFPLPRLVDGDNYGNYGYPELFADELTLYLFNIEKIFNERTDVEFRFHRFQETLGGSFADILRGKPDLVFLMDESHNIRAEKSLRAINSLNPILGLEFTATPKANNVIYAYPLRQAILDGLVKRPVVIARRDDDALDEEKEDIKIADGLRRHERKKALLETYCQNNGLPLVKPRVLISTQDIPHCERIAEKLNRGDYLDGRYKDRVLPIHSGSDDEQVQKLLMLEKIENNIEIVVHVNKLKEGWDVKTIYTIIPLRASVSDILTEQTIGRGLRLPFGELVSRNPSLSEEERKELEEIDMLDIISHERYSAVVAKTQQVLDAVQVQMDDGKQFEARQISPDGDSKYLMTIPKIQAKFHSAKEIDLGDPQVKYEQLENLKVKLVGTDLATLQERDYDEILEECQGSLVNFFVRILIEETTEFDIRDKPRLQKFVQAYLQKARVSGKNEEREKTLFKHRGKIAQDLLSQIREKITATTSVEYVVTKNYVEFHPYWRNVLTGYIEKHKDRVLEEEFTHNIITGYTKAPFVCNVFDSRQEKWTADILDRDDAVLRWVRPPTGQIPISFKSGNYNPDFIAETNKSEFYILEIKAENEIEDDDTRVKAKAAIAWCEVMSKVTGKKWEYKLIPHNVVKPVDSFKALISQAVAV